MKRMMSITRAIEKAVEGVRDFGYGQYGYCENGKNWFEGKIQAGHDQRISIRNMRAKAAIGYIFGYDWTESREVIDALCQPGSLREVVKDAVSELEKNHKEVDA